MSFGLTISSNGCFLSCSACACVFGNRGVGSSESDDCWFDKMLDGRRSTGVEEEPLRSVNDLTDDEEVGRSSVKERAELLDLDLL